MNERFGATVASGGAGGTGIGLYGGALYAEINDQIVRYTLEAGSIVPRGKEYRSPMPPMGGAQLTPDQVSAVAAYVWALSHR